MKVCSCCTRVFRTEIDFFYDTFYWRLDDKDNLYFTCSCASTLMMKNGSYDWYSPEKTLSDEAFHVFNTLSLGELIPKIPQGIARLQKALNNSNIDIKEIIKALKYEPIVLSDVLKMANIIAKSGSEQIKTVDHAVIYMGIRVLKDIVTAAALRSLSFKSTLFKYDEFWEENFILASLAEELCQKTKYNKLSDQVYLAACLANTGKIIYATCLPDMTDKIHLEMKELDISWRAAEVSLNYPDHSILGEIAGAFWGVPRYVVETSVNHHKKKLSLSRRNESEKITSIVIMANEIKNIIFQREDQCDLGLRQDAARDIGISENEIDNFIKSSSNVINLVKSNLKVA